MTIHIKPGPTPTIATFRRCPVCKHDAHLVGATQDWYDTTWTCCRCGDSWAGGELLPRPFQRYWRRRSIASATRKWYAVIGEAL